MNRPGHRNPAIVPSLPSDDNDSDCDCDDNDDDDDGGGGDDDTSDDSDCDDDDDDEVCPVTQGSIKPEADCTASAVPALLPSSEQCKALGMVARIAASLSPREATLSGLWGGARRGQGGSAQDGPGMSRLLSKCSHRAS